MKSLFVLTKASLIGRTEYAQQASAGVAALTKAILLALALLGGTASVVTMTATPAQSCSGRC